MLTAGSYLGSQTVACSPGARSTGCTTRRTRHSSLRANPSAPTNIRSRLESWTPSGHRTPEHLHVVRLTLAIDAEAHTQFGVRAVEDVAAVM